MPTEQGYSNQKKKGTAQFKTIHNTGSNAYGTATIQKSLYEITASSAISAVSEVLGSNGQAEYWRIDLPAHGASVGNVLRIESAPLKNFEFEIMVVPAAGYLYVLPIAPTVPTAGMNASVMGWVTAKASSSGTTVVSVTPAPIEFVLDGVNTQVEKDTVNPANTIPLPVEIVGTGMPTNVTLDGFVDPNNSSTTLLGAGGVFTGVAFDITNYAAINVNVKSDVASATNGVKLEVSTDGTNWDHSHSTTYTAATGVGYIFNAEFKYARVVYTNGATPQGVFRLQTIFKTTLVKSSLYTLDQTVTGNMFAELGKSTIIGKTTGGGGGFVDVKVNPSGALTTETQLVASTANIGDVDVLTLPVTYNAGNSDASTQRVVIATNQSPLSVNPVGGNLVPVAYDELVISYVGATTDISTVVYKQATATVATVTLTYDGSNRLIGVVRT